MSGLELVLLVGPPRSGKSTWREANKKGYVVVSPDRTCEIMFGHKHVPDKKYIAYKTALQMAELLLDQGKSIIVDATNINRGSRKNWFKIAEKYNAGVRCIVFKTPIEECIKRNQTCPDHEKVPNDVIVSMSGKTSDPLNDGLNYTSIEYFPKESVEDTESLSEQTAKYFK